MQCEGGVDCAPETRPGQRSDPHAFSAGCEKDLSSSASRCSRGKNVVHKKDVFAGDWSWGRNPECAAHIQPALSRCEAGLTPGGAPALECVGQQCEPPRRMTAVQEPDGMGGKHVSLVETALGVFGPVKRDRNHEHLRGGLGGKLRDGLRQTSAKFARRRNKAVVFQRMDGVFEPGFIGAISNCTHKWRRREPANAAY